MIPKCTRSMPKLSVMGSSIGTSISLAGTPSTTQPTRSTNTSMTARNTARESVSEKIASPSRPGTCSMASSQPIAMEKPMMIMITDVISIVSVSACQKRAGVSVR